MKLGRMSESAFSIDELLAHADWLRRLALHVAQGDFAAADDAVQETFVAALRSPPGRGRRAEPWMAEVLRNFLRRARRGQRARLAREATAMPAALATPDELLERAEAQRLLADLVMGLEEPFRATVLLRYFEGRSAAAIARATGVPAGTVRWRLKEGLDRLRARLEERQPGRRWLLLLLPFAPERGAGACTTAMGGLIVVTGKKSLAGLVLAVMVLLAGGLYWRGRVRSPVLPVTSKPARVGASPPRFAAAVAGPTGEVVADDSAAGSVEGTVRSAEDGSAIGGAELSFAFQDSSLPSRTDAEGRFRFAPAEPGSYLLAHIAAEGFRAFSPEWGDSPVAFVLRAGERIRGVELTLRPLRTCRGMVVDDASKPVAGARLQLWAVSRGIGVPGGDSVESDAAGRFEVPAIAGLTLEAHAGDRMAREQLGAALEPCQTWLRLGPPRPAPELSITGRLERGGVGLPGVIVEAWSNPVLEREARRGFARTTSDDDGRFALAPLDGVLYAVTAHLGGREVAVARDVRGGTQGIVLGVSAGGRIYGKVTEDRGAPVSRFAVVVSRAEPGADGRRFGVFSRYDARGGFEIDDVPAGPYRLLVLADGWQPSEEVPVEVRPEPAAAAVVTLALRAGARLRGRVIDRASHAPIGRALASIEGQTAKALVPLAAQAVSGDDGRFELTGVPPGRMSLTIVAGGHHGRVIGGLEVEAGKPFELADIELGAVKPGEPPRIELIGIGASLAPKGDAVVVGQLSPKGGAALAGLVPGDAIIAIDGQKISEFSFGAAIQRIRGAENTAVVLRIRRADGTEVAVNVVRQAITW
jgi:RNA polymerase sigma factor (sigma-70 family)